MITTTEPGRVRLWLDAARSGEYPKTEGRLHRVGQGDEADSFCVWGVACRVAADHGCEVDVFTDERFGITTYNSHHADPPFAVIRWLGLSADIGYWEYVNSDASLFVHELIARNDDPWNGGTVKPFSLAELADWIEANVELPALVDA